MNAGALCTRTVVFALPTNSVYHAAELMRRFDVGNVVVVSEDDSARRPIGLVTDRDITVKVVAQGLDSRQLDVEEIMIGEVVTVDEEASLEQVVDAMKSNGVRRMPVVNAQGGLVGILALDDIVDLLAEEMNNLAGLIRRQQERQKDILAGTHPEEEIPPPR